jgi:hypothetical protein
MESILIVERENEAASFLEKTLHKTLSPKGLDIFVERAHDPQEALALLSRNHSSPMISQGKITRTNGYDLVISASFYDEAIPGTDLWKIAPRIYDNKFMFHTRVSNEEMQRQIRQTHSAQLPVISKYNGVQFEQALKHYFKV